MNGSLSPRQQRFVQSFCIDLNGSRAAREAGYSAASGADAVSACRLLRVAKVKAAIEAHQQAKAQELELTRQNVISALLGGVQMARSQGDPGNVIKGWLAVSKLLNLDKPEVAKRVVSASGERLRAKFEDLSLDELLEIAAGRG